MVNTTYISTLYMILVQFRDGRHTYFLLMGQLCVCVYIHFTVLTQKQYVNFSIWSFNWCEDERKKKVEEKKEMRRIWFQLCHDGDMVWAHIFAQLKTHILLDYNKLWCLPSSTNGKISSVYNRRIHIPRMVNHNNNKVNIEFACISLFTHFLWK